MPLAGNSISVRDDAMSLASISSLKASLSLQLSSECEEESSYALFEKNSSIGIYSKKEAMEFLLDFRKKSFIQRIESELSSKDPLLRAIGKTTKTIFDMTMGFAKDAALLAASGREVWACEKNPIVFAMVEQALENISSARNSITFSQEEKSIFSKIHSSLHIYKGDSSQCLRSKMERDYFDAVYIDSMFSYSKKLRKKSKEVELLKTLVEKGDRKELFLHGKVYAKKRIVVKRSLKEVVDYPQKPSFQVKARSHCFDVFLFPWEAS